MKKSNNLFLYLIISGAALAAIVYFWMKAPSSGGNLTKEAENVEKILTGAADENDDLEDAISSSGDNSTSNEPRVDLEKTVEVMHGMDMARSKFGSFREYLEFMAKQNYEGVAPDVLEAKAKILPILSKLQRAEERLEDNQAVWNTFKNISEIVVADMTTIGASALTAGFTPDMMNDFLDMGKSSFEIIREKEEIEEKIKKEIDDIEDEYLEYLNAYTPVYLKYMSQWDRVCLMRDNAYLEIHNGNIEAAMQSADEVLKISPTDREATIIKAFCLLMKNGREIADNPEVKPAHGENAKALLDQYIKNNSDRSAPALLLLGTYHWQKGETERALSYYDQSAVEYPRQSEYLLHMLNSYRQRTYLRKSAEGSYILEMYKSTMEGFGFFSPNFQKAMMHSEQNNFETSKDEIMKHFFRRGSQSAHDYMIADMVHCETYLPETYNQIFSEKSFLDLEATTTMWDSKELNIKIKNRSDLKLSNVRVFLCIHFTDMYADDYEVFKVNTTINKIEPYSTADFGNIEINFELLGKEKELDKDIVSARAIIITDDIISWVDEEDFKINVIKESQIHPEENKKSIEVLDQYYAPLKKSGEEIYKVVKDDSKITAESSMLGVLGKEAIKLTVPRILVHTNPYFSINELSSAEAKLPESVKLNGSKIEVIFKHKIEKNGKVSIFLNSKNVRIKWDVFFNEDGQISGTNNYLI